VGSGAGVGSGVGSGEGATSLSVISIKLF
jgi:hypothetical protein